MIVSLLLIGSISLISAGFWNTITGNAPKEVTLSVTGAPEITNISDVNGEMNSGPVSDGNRDLTPGVMTTITYDFYVYHPRGFNYLPGPGRTPSAYTETSERVNLTLTNIDNSIIREGVCANTDDSATCPEGVGFVGDTCVKYTCDVDIRYYDNPSSVTKWTVNASVKDSAGYIDSDTNINGLAQPIRKTYFNDLSFSDIIGGNLAFGPVSYGIQNKQPTDAPGTYPLKINNTGNVDISETNITAYDIPDAIDGLTDSISADSFNASGNADPCATIEKLSDTNSIGVGIPIISPNTDSSGDLSQDLRIALCFIAPSVDPIDYSTDPLLGYGGTNWDIGTEYYP